MVPRIQMEMILNYKWGQIIRGMALNDIRTRKVESEELEVF